MKEYLVISTSIELVRTPSEGVIYITSDGNYSTFMLTSGTTYTIALQLGQVERLLDKQLARTGSDFIRIGKSLIINRHYITYINPSRQQLTLSDGRSSHNQTASKEALKQLKDLIDKDLK